MTEVLDTNSTPTETTETPKFKFDVASIEVDIDISTNPEVQRILSAKMRRATKDEHVKREAMSLVEFVEATATEEDINSDAQRANAWLFDQTATHVKGFRFKAEPKEAANQWREVTPEVLSRIPREFKSSFVASQYDQVTAKFVETDTEDEGFVFGEDGDLLSVDLIFGDVENPMYVVRFSMPEPSETARKSYSSESVKVRQVKGSRKSRNRIVQNLAASVKFFKTLMSHPDATISDNATFADRTFDQAKSNPIGKGQFLDGIDPIYQRFVVSALMSKYNAKVSD